MALPRIALANIKAVGLPAYAFMADDKESRCGWSGSLHSPLYRNQAGLALVTPFASFLAIELPKLEDIYFRVPMFGEADFYCGLAPRDLHKVLRHGHIKRLHHVFSGKETSTALKEKDSETCIQHMLGDLPDRVIDHRLRLLNRYPQKVHRKQMLRWMDAQSEYYNKHRYSFAGDWEWGRERY